VYLVAGAVLSLRFPDNDVLLVELLWRGAEASDPTLEVLLVADAALVEEEGACARVVGCGALLVGETVVLLVGETVVLLVVPDWLLVVGLAVSDLVPDVDLVVVGLTLLAAVVAILVRSISYLLVRLVRCVNDLCGFCTS
jgi:hypothetical protein